MNLLQRPLPPFKPLPPGKIWLVDKYSTGMDEVAMGVQAFGRGSHVIPWPVWKSAEEVIYQRSVFGRQSISHDEQMHIILCLWARYLIEQEYVEFEPVATEVVIHQSA